MGNSGSVHNINWESNGGGFTTGRSKSELNGYYQRGKHHHGATQDSETQTQTLLRRQHGNGNAQKMDRTKSLPMAMPAEQFKVLPKIGAERLKLRPTSNGMLLHAGGTISGRNKEDLQIPGLMQRSRTQIYDQRDEEVSSRANAPPMPGFQRSQTLLHLNYNERDNVEREIGNKFTNIRSPNRDAGHHAVEKQNLRHARSEPNVRNDLNRPTSARQSTGMNSANVTNTTLTKAPKLNKYNKKRKAPAAPMTTTPTAAAPTAANPPTKVDCVDDRTTVTRRFRTLANTKTQQHQAPQQSPQQLPMTMPSYRREKSCDAILLRKKDEVAHASEKRYSFGGNIDKAQLPAQAVTKTTTTTSAVATSKPASKIPQLKRTFYFGMQTTASTTADSKMKTEVTIPRPPQQQTLELTNEAAIQSKTLERKNENIVVATPAIVIASDTKDEELNICSYRLQNDIEITTTTGTQIVLDEESRINDNGLVVHIRPALPRRQQEVPSFSPAAAWRMLMNTNTDEHRQLQRTTSHTLSCESPIQLKSMKLAAEVEELRQQYPLKTHKHTLAWTPQQDLEDDEDDEVHSDADDSTSSDDYGDKDEEDGLLFFNGHTKKNRNETLTLKANEKTSLAVHMFSLSLPRDAHVDAHMQKKNSIGSSNNNEKLPGFSSLQKLKLSISGGNKCTCRASITKFSTSNMESSTDPEICEIHSCQTVLRSDNWVLHKTGTKDGANSATANSVGKLLKDDITPTVEPISLSYLTGGKHIMYLPGITAPAHDNGVDEEQKRKDTTPTRDLAKTSTKSRQRKKETRESLQDEMPVLRQQQSQPVSSTQRFSFQSTVRMLEKRRLAEKLSRDAEIREAQRKSELEAMKRVEEDFQRKRASEKANIRHQLRLYCSGTDIESNNLSININEPYNSLPMPAGSNNKSPSQNHFYRQQLPQKHDSNNNKISCRRAEPDGAAASPSPQYHPEIETHHFSHKISHLPLKRLDSDTGDIDAQNLDITNFQRTASLVEPYLQSFMK